VKKREKTISKKHYNILLQ